MTGNFENPVTNKFLLSPCSVGEHCAQRLPYLDVGTCPNIII